MPEEQKLEPENSGARPPAASLSLTDFINEGVGGRRDVGCRDRRRRDRRGRGKSIRTAAEDRRNRSDGLAAAESPATARAGGGVGVDWHGDGISDAYEGPSPTSTYFHPSILSSGEAFKLSLKTYFNEANTLLNSSAL